MRAILVDLYGTLDSLSMVVMTSGLKHVHLLNDQPLTKVEKRLVIVMRHREGKEKSNLDD
jgi:hypothetical protein